MEDIFRDHCRIDDRLIADRRVPLRRITSYNVCYTKLLREVRIRRMNQGIFTHIDGRGDTDTADGDAQGRYRITSYNVCYTKLLRSFSSLP